MSRSRIHLFALVCAALALAACSGSSTGKSASTTSAPRSVGHVFVIVLENKGYQATFGDPGADPYLAQTLASEGVLLSNYYAVGHSSLDNYIALTSGQPPNTNTSADCVGGFHDFDITAGQESFGGATGIQEGNGCVYPAAVQNLGNQLSAKGLMWKGYMEDMGNNPSRDGTPNGVCGHPGPNGADPTVFAAPGDGYATRHDPFVYFHAVIDSTATCAGHVVPLGSTSGAMPPGNTAGATGLATDLASITTTPAFSWISPNLCNDGHDFPCTNEQAPGTSALADTDAFVKAWVPLITGSPAFRHDGLLIITFDEADTADASSCCNEQSGPAEASPGGSGPGGGRVGALLISPLLKGGTVVATPMNHYSTLASIEDIFGLARLGYAQTAQATLGPVLASRR